MNTEKINQLLKERQAYENQILEIMAENENAKLEYQAHRKKVRGRIRIQVSHIELIDRELADHGYIKPNENSENSPAVV